MDDTSQLILTELREFRAAVQSWQQDTGERVATLEAQVKSGITGNGQPSRLQVVEDAVEELSGFKYWVLGAAAAISTIVHYFLPSGAK